MSEDYSSNPLEQRLIESAVAWLSAQTSIVALDAELRDQDDESPISPKDAPKKSRLIVTATDEGMATTSVNTPIRRIRLAITWRANSKTEAGGFEELHAAGAAMERLFDDTNLKEALDNAGLGVRVMHAVRRPGVGRQRDGMIRRLRHEIECKCVAAERTA